MEWSASSTVTGEARGGLSKRLAGVSARVHSGIRRYFTWHGQFVCQRPWTIICVCILMSISCIAMYYAINEQELDSKELFTPKNAQSFDDKEIYEELYGVPPSQTRIVVTRNVDLSREEDCSKRALLADNNSARRFFMEIFSLFEAIHEMQIEYRHESYGLEDLCQRSRSDSPCNIMSILAAWNNSVSVLLADPDPIKTVTSGFTDAYGRELSENYLLGVDDGHGGCKGSTEAIQNWILLNYEPEAINGARYDPRNREWNRQLVNLIERWQSKDLDFFVSNLDAVDMQSEKTLEKDQRLLWISYAVVLIYCHIALFKNSRTQCKSHLAIISSMSVIMAIYSAYGICQLFGVKFNPVHRVLPFLLMGLGVDDTFVIMSAYHSTEPSMSVSEKIQMTSARAGSAILVTSVTDFVAFLSGTFTTLIGLRDFSIYAAVGILFDFFYQVTFFLAFLALDAKREQRCHDQYLVEEERPLNSQSSSYGEDAHNNAVIPMREFLNGHQLKADELISDSEEEEYLVISALGNKRLFAGPKLIGSGPYVPTPTFASRLVGNWMPKLTLTRIGKIGVLLAEVVLLGFGIYGCTQVKMDFRYEEWFIPDGSYLHQAFKIERDYFNGNQFPFHAITLETCTNAHFDAQEDLWRFGQALREDPHVAAAPPIRFWFEDFMQYSAATEPATHFQNASFVDPDAFLSALHRYLDGPGQAYSGNVIFNDSTGELMAAKVSAFTKGIGSGWSAVHTVDSIRDTVSRGAPELDPLAYSYGFLYFDGFRVIAWETTRNVMIAAAAVFAMTLIILANFLACVAVLLMVILTDVMLFGVMWYLGLTFNSVTCICMVLAVGIAVDYSVHIAHSFLSVPGSRQRRAEQALHRIGGAVLNGAFTTGLAIVVLAFGEHYIFQTFFKMFIAIVICGVWHGLVILPVFLNLLGPAPYNVAELHA